MICRVKLSLDAFYSHARKISVLFPLPKENETNFFYKFSLTGVSLSILSSNHQTVMEIAKKMYRKSLIFIFMISYMFRPGSGLYPFFQSVPGK